MINEGSKILKTEGLILALSMLGKIPKNKGILICFKSVALK
jgi:hypothetical protein